MLHPLLTELQKKEVHPYSCPENWENCSLRPFRLACGKVVKISELQNSSIDQNKIGIISRIAYFILAFTVCLPLTLLGIALHYLHYLSFMGRKSLFNLATEAINQDDIKSLYIALWKGLNVNGIDHEGIPLLHKAINRGRLDCTRVLLLAGADVHQRDEWGFTPLFKAIQLSFFEIVEVLLKADAKVTFQNNYGATLLSEAIACYAKHKFMIQLFEEEGKSPNIIDYNKKKLKDCFKTIQTLIKADAGKYASACAKTPLMLASALGCDNIVKVLLKANVNVNTQRDTGETALTYAALSNNVRCVRVLLAAGAEIAIGSPHETTILCEVLLRSTEAVREALLDWDVPPLPPEQRHGITRFPPLLPEQHHGLTRFPLLDRDLKSLQTYTHHYQHRQRPPSLARLAAKAALRSHRNLIADPRGAIEGMGYFNFDDIERLLYGPPEQQNQRVRS